MQVNNIALYYIFYVNYCLPMTGLMSGHLQASHN